MCQVYVQINIEHDNAVNPPFCDAGKDLSRFADLWDGAPVDAPATAVCESLATHLEIWTVDRTCGLALCRKHAHAARRHIASAGAFDVARHNDYSTGAMYSTLDA